MFRKPEVFLRFTVYRNGTLTQNGLTLPVPILDKEKKLTQNFYFHTSFWCLKDFMKAVKVFIKPFEEPQRIMKIKILS